MHGTMAIVIAIAIAGKDPKRNTVNLSSDSERFTAAEHCLSEALPLLTQSTLRVAQ